MKIRLIALSLLIMGCTAIHLYKNSKFSTPHEFIGVYWGAFDPPTKAHHAIIAAALKNIPLKKLIVVVNNHSYKNYTYPLETRIQLLALNLPVEDKKKIEILWQDDLLKLDYAFLRKSFQKPICAIAGYDAYKSWLTYSNANERALYDAIAIVPRGDDSPMLFDPNAFLLFIDPAFKYTSSTELKKKS